MSNNSKFLGFIFGGLIGAGLGLMYAPRSGDETRQIIIDDTNRLADQTMKSIQEAQQKALNAINESQTRIERLNKETRERLSNLQEIAQTTLEEQKEILVKGVSDVKDVIKESEMVEG